MSGAVTWLMAAMAGESVGEVQVTTPVTVIHSVGGATVHAGVQFQTDGGLDEIGPNLGDLTAYNAGEWWSEEPQTGIGSAYDVRCSAINSGSWSSAAAATGTWVNISTAPIWRNTVVSMASPSSQQVNANFQIRIAGGGATVATFVVIAEAFN